MHCWPGTSVHLGDKAIALLTENKPRTQSGLGAQKDDVTLTLGPGPSVSRQGSGAPPRVLRRRPPEGSRQRQEFASSPTCPGVSLQTDWVPLAVPLCPTRRPLLPGLCFPEGPEQQMEGKGTRVPDSSCPDSRALFPVWRGQPAGLPRGCPCHSCH